MALAKQLRRLRKRAGLSCRELGFLAGISESHPNLIESGRRPNVDAGIVDRLAEVFGCTTDLLIRGTGTPPTDDELQASVSSARVRFEKAQQRRRRAAGGGH